MIGEADGGAPAGTPVASLLEDCPVAYLAVARDGAVLACNHEATLLLQRRREELVGGALVDWVAPFDRLRCQARLREALRGVSGDWQAAVRRGDGLERRFDFCARAGGVESCGAVALFLVPAGSEDRLRPELARLSPLLENIPGQFLAILDRDGRIRYSAGLARTHWQADADWLGRDFVFLLAPDEPNRAAFASLRRDLESRGQWSGVLWHVRGDGARFPVESFAIPSRDPRSDAVVGMLLAGRDASAEHEARAAAAGAARLATVGGVAARVAAELVAGVERARSSLGAEPHRAEAEPHRAEAELERLAGLAAALVAYVGEDGVGGDAPADVCAVLGEALARANAGSAGRVRWSGEPPAALPAVALGAGALGRIVDELLGNALEAVAGRRDPRVRLDASAVAPGVVIRVHDDGPGLPPDPEAIFAPFFTTKPGRFGVGLATARRSAEAAGGRLRAERLASGWTTLTLELPSERPRPETPFRAVPLRLPRARTLLVVDDDAAFRAVARTLLERVGYRVAEAWSGRSALAQLGAGDRIELVLTDLRMRDGTGYWLLKRLGEDYPELLRRTVIMTGDPSLAAVEALSRETGCPVIRKPLDVQLLLEVLDETARRALD